MSGEGAREFSVISLIVYKTVGVTMFVVGSEGSPVLVDAIRTGTKRELGCTPECILWGALSAGGSVEAGASLGGCGDKEGTKESGSVLGGRVNLYK